MSFSQSTSVSPSLATIIFEVTPRCNNHCLFCYNVWKGNQPYPDGELYTAGAKAILLKIRQECSSRYLAFSGGEPLMRHDMVELVSYASWLGFIPTLITNGTLLKATLIQDLIRAGIRLFELPLLAPEKSVHDQLCQNKSFEAVIDSLITIKEKKGKVVVVFVATRLNIRFLEETIKLCLAIGVDGVMLNRFNPGGEGSRHIDELLPTLEEMKDALEIANKLAQEYEFSISCGIAIQPCLIDTGRFKNVSFGYCSAGTDRSYYTIDPLGNFRVCNHSPTILGNILTESYTQLTTKRSIAQFVQTVPEYCIPCSSRSTCQGGCKAAAQVCYGSLDQKDPFLEKNLIHSVRH